MTVKPIETLATLARKINALNTGVVEQMVQSGKLLLEAKTKLKQENSGKRGGFQEWVRQNLKITPQTATRYMRLAKSRNPLKTYGTQVKKHNTKTGRNNAAAPNWTSMSPVNRAKTAFNALEGEARQDFLKWIADQLGENSHGDSKTVITATRQRSSRSEASAPATV